MAGLRIRKRTNSFLLGFILFLLAGILFSGLGYYMLTSNIDMTKNGVLTKATVVEITRHDARKSTTYKPVIEYTTSTGETIRTEYSSGSSNRNAYAVGEQITIYYSKTDPNKVLIDKFLDKYGFPAIFMFAGILGIVMAVIMTVRKIKYGVA